LRKILFPNNWRIQKCFWRSKRLWFWSLVK